MTSELKPCPFCGAEVPCTDQACPLNTRTTPSADPLSGLVRYGISMFGNGAVEMGEGEYVLHSEAAKIAINLKQDADAWRLNCKGWQDEAKAAKAELAQIKAQEPVGYVSKAFLDGRDYCDIFKDVAAKVNFIPVYAAPVSDSLKAENERLIELLKDVTTHLGNLINTDVKFKQPYETALSAHDRAVSTLNVEASNDK
ncbi:MAG: restriction alleviation protein [Caudoviricetes sp.]|nr:MAG: restriction alleviation protein [Caudoviricetes sp.]